MERAQIQEELELILVDLQAEKIEKGEELKSSDIKNALEERLSGIKVQEMLDNYLFGEYNNYSFIIKDNIIKV